MITVKFNRLFEDRPWNLCGRSTSNGVQAHLACRKLNADIVIANVVGVGSHLLVVRDTIVVVCLSRGVVALRKKLRVREMSLSQATRCDR